MYLKKSKKLYIHIDCDSFFASCEVYADPSLKNKYVCVGDQIITACTYNCKSMGIKTGTPIWEAEQILGKQGVFLKPNFNLYALVSNKLLNYLNNNVFGVEPFSIDESFCEITGIPEYFKLSLDNYLKKLQKEILEEVGVPVSIGCANTKIKAKIFSKIKKPFGIYIGINDNEIKNLFQKTPLSKIPFIGRKSQEKLKYKCSTIYDFIQLGYWNIKKLLGKGGTDLWLELVGINSFVIWKNHSPKSISRSRSFNRNITNNKIFLWKELRVHFEIVFSDVIKNKFEIKNVAILFRDKSFKTYIFEYKFKEYVSNRNIIYKVVSLLFEENYNYNLIYRSMGIIMSDFRKNSPMQLTLFSQTTKKKVNDIKLYETINNINDVYGLGKLGFGQAILTKRPYYKSKCF